MADNILLKQIKGGDLTVTDDGTYYIVQHGSVKLYKIRKSDGQLLIAGGVTTDVTL